MVKIISPYAHPNPSGSELIRRSVEEGINEHKKLREKALPDKNQEEAIKNPVPKLTKEQFDAKFNNAFFSDYYIATHWRAEIWEFIEPFINKK